jgi:peptide/nickel transport system substrate-binding protein
MPLTTDDVLFTIEQANNSSLRSPVFPNWDGVLIEKIDDYTITFTLTEPYAPFIENLTIGILPAHIWNGLTPEKFSYSDFNIQPVGSGPYMYKSIERDNSGIPLRYILNKFDEYALGEPYISTIEFQLFNNNEEALKAYKAGKVHAVNAITPIQLEEFLNSDSQIQTAIHRAPLLRTFGIFFNHNKQPLFLEDEVREALKEATPKKAIIGEILRGYGTVLDSPLPSYITDAVEEEILQSATESTNDEDAQKTSVNHIERARAILEDNGWEKGEDGIYKYENDESEVKLSITFSTVNIPELVQVAERILDSWREVGIEVQLKVFNPTDLTQSVIRPRKFDALLFGMEIGHELDLYAFWHSSQRNDPGLNIAQYADIEADALLEKMRVEQDIVVRKKLYQDFTELVKKQNSAIFLYTPDFIYVVNKKVNNVAVHPISETSERFDSVHLWNIETDNVWFFLQDFFEK